jgi:hypothetical protein
MPRPPAPSLLLAILLLLLFFPAHGTARVKLVALPEREGTVLRLDNPAAALVEEERLLTLQQGINEVDFSWKGVQVDEDSIRLRILSPADGATVLNVSYPPDENALVWEMHAKKPLEAKVRISYLLSGMDRLIAYKGVANRAETRLDFKTYMVLRNFSGEHFENARIVLGAGRSYERSTTHGETQRLLLLKRDALPIKKIWTFDARKLPWDPQKLDRNVGIPVSYRIRNDREHRLGEFVLWSGKARIYQRDGSNGTIFLGEDRTKPVPVGEEAGIRIGKSRDIVVTQRKKLSRRVNVRRNEDNRIVLHDVEEIVEAKIENFKDGPATLTLLEQIPGEWEMRDCNREYVRRDAHTLEFTIDLQARGEKSLVMHYVKKHLR